MLCLERDAFHSRQVVRSELIDRAGSSGWMADFGEALPCEGIRLHSGGDACAAHNSYAVEWAQLHREAIAEAGIDGFFFSRSAYTRFWRRFITVFKTLSGRAASNVASSPGKTKSWSVTSPPNR